MNDLIERLKKAIGPDRELDGEIYWLAERGRARRSYWTGTPGLPKEPPDALPATGLGRHAVIQSSPKYTSSIDAALTLVPKGYAEPGWYGDRFYLVANGSAWTCAIQWAEGVGHWSERWKETASKAQSAALAVCIAALKARQSVSHTSPKSP